MANLTYVSAPAPGGQTLYEITVNGTVVVGETYTVNSTLGVIAQYTAVTGDDNAAVAAGMLASINPTYTSGVTTTNPNAFGFHIPGTVTSTPTTSPTPPPAPTPPPPVVTSIGTTIDYGLRFKCEFDPPNGGPFAFKSRYLVEIYQKNYTGPVSSVAGGKSPVIHQWQTDDIKAPVRGSSLLINLINSGAIPLRTFYSVEDDEFKVKFYWRERVLLTTVNNLLFEGFLVLDDCNEAMLDYEHDISLTASDGLGLLKDVPLDKAPASYSYFNGGTEILMATAPHLLKIGIGLGRQVQVGDKIEIIGTSIAGIYNIASMVESGLYLEITTVEPITTLAPTSTTINILRNNLIGRVTLLSIIHRCLSATGLRLKTNIYCNLFEYNQLNTSSFLDQTLIDAQTYLKNNTDYEDCYPVLEKVLERFNLSLFQAEGEWQIIRWDELRYYSNLIPGFNYDADMSLVGAVTLSAALIAEPNLPPASLPVMYPTFQLSNKIFRSYKYVKETFNYKQPPHLLRNNDLQILGNQITDYNNGLTADDFRRFKEYHMPWWYDSDAAPTTFSAAAEYFIRIVYDQFDNELERYAVVKFDNIKSDKIEATAGDTIKYSFSLRTAFTLGTIQRAIVIWIELDNGTTKQYVKKPPFNAPPIGEKTPVWSTDPQGFVQEYAGDTQGEWTSVTIDTPRIPSDGILKVYLSIFFDAINNNTVETHYKDIRFEYNALINNSTKIIGQTNLSEQIKEIKQRQEKEVHIDSSPRNFISGTLFLPSFNGLIQKRTAKWKRAHIPLERRNLGNITTRETLFWRRLSRTILEGSFIGLIHDTGQRHLSLLSAMRYNHGPAADLNFVWGKLEIDYENDMVNNSPIWEIYKDGEVDADLLSEYLFKYLYETK